MRLFVLLLLLFSIQFITLNAGYVVPPVNLPSAPYDIWAHYHWVWLANGSGRSKSDILKLVSDYLSYDIPVGAVNIDSAWPSKYQNFIWNSTKISKCISNGPIVYIHKI